MARNFGGADVLGRRNRAEDERGGLQRRAEFGARRRGRVAGAPALAYRAALERRLELYADDRRNEVDSSVARSGLGAVEARLSSFAGSADEKMGNRDV